MSIVVLPACVQTLVVLTGNLDLSVGSVMGLVAYVVYDLSERFEAVHGLVLPMALVFGALLGLLNGVLVAVLDIPVPVTPRAADHAGLSDAACAGLGR